jgi:hypothetical protein
LFAKTLIKTNNPQATQRLLTPNYDSQLIGGMDIEDARNGKQYHHTFGS